MSGFSVGVTAGWAGWAAQVASEVDDYGLNLVQIDDDFHEYRIERDAEGLFEASVDDRVVAQKVRVGDVDWAAEPLIRVGLGGTGPPGDQLGTRFDDVLAFEE